MRVCNGGDTGMFCEYSVILQYPQVRQNTETSVIKCSMETNLNCMIFRNSGLTSFSQCFRDIP